MSRNDILGQIARYYAGRVVRYGPTPQGVDWNSVRSQHTRFAQFERLWLNARVFSLNDLGCGYAALADYLVQRGVTVDYLGVDISGEMVRAATSRFSGIADRTFQVGDTPNRVADYCVASGIFNVRLDVPDSQWSEHILSTLERMAQWSRLGFAFNCLTSYSDLDHMRSDLYYANPLELFDHCKRRFSRDIALLHDYGLYEFTIIVRKPVPEN